MSSFRERLNKSMKSFRNPAGPSERAFDYLSRSDRSIPIIARSTLAVNRQQDMMLIPSTPVKQFGHSNNSYDSYNYSNYYSYTVSDGYSSSDPLGTITIGTAEGDELPSVHFDTDNEGVFFPTPPRIVQAPPKEAHRQNPATKIPVFRFPSSSSSSASSSQKTKKHASNSDNKSRSSGRHNKAPPLKEVSPLEFTTDEETSTNQLSRAPGFIMQLDTPSELDYREPFYVARPKQIYQKDRKAPPLLLEEGKKSSSNSMKYEAPLQKAAEEYRRAALEEKERLKKLEEEQEKRKAMLVNRETKSVRVPLQPALYEQKDNASDLSSPLPKPKKVKKKVISSQENKEDNQAAPTIEERQYKSSEPHSVEIKRRLIDNAQTTKTKKKKKGKKKAKVTHQPIVVFNSAEESSYEEDAPQKSLRTKTFPKIEIHSSTNSGSEDSRPPPVLSPSTTFSSMIPTMDEKGKVVLKPVNSVALNKLMYEDEQGTDDSFFHESVNGSFASKRMVDEVELDSFGADYDGSPFKFQKPALYAGDVELEPLSVSGNEIDISGLPTLSAYTESTTTAATTSPSTNRATFGGMPDSLHIVQEDEIEHIYQDEIELESLPIPKNNKSREQELDSLPFSDYELNSNHSFYNSKKQKDSPPQSLKNEANKPFIVESIAHNETKKLQSKRVIPKQFDTSDSLSSSIPAPKIIKKKKISNASEEASTLDSFSHPIIQQRPTHSADSTQEGRPHKSHRNHTMDIESPYKAPKAQNTDSINKAKPKLRSEQKQEPTKPGLDLDEFLQNFKERKARQEEERKLEEKLKAEEERIEKEKKLVEEQNKAEEAARIDREKKAIEEQKKINDEEKDKLAKEPQTTKKYTIEQKGYRSVDGNERAIIQLPTFSESVDVKNIEIESDNLMIGQIPMQSTTISNDLSSRRASDVLEPVKKKPRRVSKKNKQPEIVFASSHSGNDFDQESSILTHPEELPTITATQFGEDRHNAFRWNNYRDTIPTVSKAQLSTIEIKFITPIDNPTEPIKGWLKFQVGLIPNAETTEQVRTASEKFDFEDLLKQMRAA